MIIQDANASALLRTICSDPSDDLPRLAYADWLEEQGTGSDLARAEFIRVQIAYANLQSEECACGFIDPPGRICDVCLGQRRERELFYHLYSVLLAGLPFGSRCVLALDDDTASALPVLRYSRGFVGDAALPLASWLTHGPALVTCQPITTVRLTDRKPGRGWYFEAVVEKPASKDFWSWGLQIENASARSDSLPHYIYQHLDASIIQYHKQYLSEEDALAALSRACVTWARQEAGLPPLPR